MAVAEETEAGSREEGGLRIVSLLPSITEILSAVGAGGQVVGITHECDHPRGVRNPVGAHPRRRWRQGWKQNPNMYLE